MYFGEPLELKSGNGDKTFKVLQPTIGDILEINEVKFYSTLHVFVTNTTSCRLFLWDAGLDWNEVSDFQLFCILYHSIDPDVSRLLFGDLDWSSFQVMQKKDDESFVLWSEKELIEINEDIYEHIHQYLQNVFNMHPEVELTDDPILKKWWVDKDRRSDDRKKKNKDEKSFSMQSMISAMVNHPGFKYSLKELKDVGVSEFYDSVNRLQIYESSTALMKGMYSGMISAKDLDPDSYNWMKDIG